jgi:DNA-binding transcriptional LysR family regulator
MDPLDGLTVFVTVARCGGFSAAAERLGCSKSTVSAQVTRLERRIGARLLRRSTRSVSLTEAGRAYLRQVDDVLDRVHDAELAARAEASEPRGVLRVSAPVPFAWTHLAPLLPDFMQRYPDVRIDLQVAAEAVDLVTEGFDVAVRLCTRPASPSMIVRRIGQTRLSVLAAPSLVDGCRPVRPEDLLRWPRLTNSIYSTRNEWRFERGGEVAVLPLDPLLITNSPEVLQQLVLTGSGVGLLSEYAAVEDLRAGRLVRLLPDWCIADVPVLAIYPDNRQIAVKVRTFVDFLARRLSPDVLTADGGAAVAARAAAGA